VDPTLIIMLAVFVIAGWVFVREEEVAHATWTIVSPNLSGAELAQCFAQAAGGRFHALEVVEQTVTIQPPDRQWLLTLCWIDRYDGAGVAEMFLEQAPEMVRLGSTDWGLAIDLIRRPWLVSDRMRRFVKDVRALDPSADIGRRRTLFR
jgi:hypothetical protein